MTDEKLEGWTGDEETIKEEQAREKERDENFYQSKENL